MPLVVLQTAKTPDKLDYTDKLTRTQISNKIGIPMMAKSFEVTEKDIKKYTALMEKTKKPAEFYIDFDGTDFIYGVRVGSTKDQITSRKLTTDGEKMPDLDKARANLIMFGAATKKQVDALKERNL